MLGILDKVDAFSLIFFIVRKDYEIEDWKFSFMQIH